MAFNIETESGLQLLEVFPGDDPARVAGDFCERFAHEPMREAIAAIITEQLTAMGLEDKVKL